MTATQNVNVQSITPLVSPKALKSELSATSTANNVVIESRETIKAILRREDKRLLVLVGPCSIHDHKAALEYAGKLGKLRQELQDRLFVVMRIYFSKPRTTIGWKGLINDPCLDGSCDLAAGLRLARRILLEINELGVPAGTELLDPVTPQYIADLISWSAIGARTTESQTHREMASGLSMPVGYKNGMDGNLQIAIDAIIAAKQQHSFLGVDEDGLTCIVKTTGNPWGHVILRGGRSRPNYDEEAVHEAIEKLKPLTAEPAIMVDCSHSNSGSKQSQQEMVWKSVVQQRVRGNQAVIGLMAESNLFEGKQPIPADLSQLRYGVSITDECVSWETTERMLRYAHAELAREVAVAP
jgi:3-deoxy-7-phosphoheptulonate synthase